MDKKKFSLRLARLRNKKGVSAREMSLSLGQNPNYINNIETERSLPSLPGLAYICEYLNITERDFFDYQSEHPEKLNAIIEDLKKLNDEDLQIISALVKKIANK